MLDNDKNMILCLYELCQDKLYRIDLWARDGVDYNIKNNQKAEYTIYYLKAVMVQIFWSSEFIVNSGKLRHSLVTMEGEKELIDFYRALLSRECSPIF